MRGEAVVAAVSLRDCERDPLPGLQVEGLRHRPHQPSPTAEGVRADGHEAIVIWHEAEHLVDVVENCLGFGGRLVAPRDSDAGHILLR